MTTDPCTPSSPPTDGAPGDRHGSHGPADPSTGDPVTPGQAQVGEAELDRSAGESGAPSDMDYYRTTQKTGSRLALGTLALPIVLVVLVLLGMVLLRP